MTRPPPTSTLFPYTTLFRSQPLPGPCHAAPRGSRYPARCDPRRECRQKPPALPDAVLDRKRHQDRKSTRLNSSHVEISYAVFCLKKKKKKKKDNIYVS